MEISFFMRNGLIFMIIHSMRIDNNGRNGIYLARKHKEKSLVASIYRELRDMFIVLIFEKDKIEKLKSSLKGFSDGLKMPV